MRAALLLVLCAGCAHVEKAPEPKPEVSEQERAEAGRLALAELLVEVCTDKATTAERIQVTEFILRTCHWPVLLCARKACKELTAEGDKKRSRNIGWRP